MRHLSMVLAAALAATPLAAQDNTATAADPESPAMAANEAVTAVEVIEPDGAVDSIVPAPEYGPIMVTDETVAEFKWTARLAVVFADSPLDPAFIRQIELLMDRPEALQTRDVVILTDTNPAAGSALRRELRPRGFAMVVIDKDSRVMMRKPSPWDVRELTRAIDKTPLREQELRDQQAIQGN